MPTHCFNRCIKNEYGFGAELLRWIFGLLFIIAAVQKLKMGTNGFAEMLSSAQTPLAQAFPTVLYTYGIVLPLVELVAGALLLLHFHVKEAYFVIGVLYVSFAFGMLYDGNTQIVSTQYIPATMALSLAMFFHIKSEEQSA